MTTRQPAVAGAFYPADAKQLNALVDHYLNAVKTPSTAPKAIIAPHAGFIYSGPVAASAYARLKQASNIIHRVVLIGPSHRIGFKGLAVSRANSFSTPLGEITLDQQAIAKISTLPYVEYLEKAHTYEHSLEVHLPFLQKTLQSFSLIPIVAGSADAKQVAEVLELLWGGRETLIVISSDLSHYKDYNTARQLDRMTSHHIEQLKYELLDMDAACGQVPVSGLLAVARKKQLTIKTIDLRNSGDTAGDKHSVVGYGAYVIEP